MASSMPRRLWCHLLWQLALFSPIVHGQAGSTTTWARGMAIQMFVTEEATCPQSLKDATSNNMYQTIYSNDSSIFAGSQLPATAIRDFYLTNGWHEALAPFDSNGNTSVMLAESVGNCWSVDSSNTALIVSPCELLPPQAFYVDAPSSFNSTKIWSHDSSAIISPIQGDGALTVDPSSKSSVCVYDSGSGLFVVAPSDPTQRHIQSQDITNLTNVMVPGPQEPLSFINLPGCSVADDLYSNVSFYDNSIDCAIAKAINGMPQECESDPQARMCILNLFPAFCGDLQSNSSGGNPLDINSCFDNIGSGPCVANPAGAACLSGQFAGIQYVVGGGGSGSSKRDNSGGLFNDQAEDVRPLEDQFWGGVMKNLINQGIALVNFFADAAAHQMQVACYAGFMVHDLFNVSLRDKMKTGCMEAFKPHQVVRPLEYSNDLETAGSIFADVVLVLDGVASIAEAIKVVGLVDGYLLRFAPKNTPTDLLGQGYYLEASGTSSIIRIYRGDGSAAALLSDLDRVTLENSIKQSAFENCKYCIPGKAGKRENFPRVPSPVKSLCCFVLDVFGGRSPKSASQNPWARPVNKAGFSITATQGLRSIGELTTSSGIKIPEKRLLETMRSLFSRSFLRGGFMPLGPDAVTEAFYNARYVQDIKDAEIFQKATSMYGVKVGEIEAINTWVNEYTIVDSLNSGFAQIPGSQGICYRTTDLTSDAFQMLTTGAPGIRSNGPAGIYQVQDLLRAESYFGELQGGGQIQIMASYLGLMREFDSSCYYRFMINSRTGRYIEPLLIDNPSPEVDFIQGWSNFKLLGWETLNGGEAGKIAGRRGPFAVFYFDEIDLGVAQPRICSETVTSFCRPEILVPPWFNS